MNFERTQTVHGTCYHSLNRAGTFALQVSPLRKNVNMSETLARPQGLSIYWGG